MALRTVGVRLTAEVSGYIAGMERAKLATTDFKGQLDKSAETGKLDKVAGSAALVGGALLGMAGYAIKTAADFDKSMSAVKAATYDSSMSVQDNTKQMGLLRAAALQAGKDTSFSATQAADGITELAKAGVHTSDILSGGLKGALDLAAAGQVSVGEAASVASTALTDFKLKGEQIPHVADLLAAAAGKAQGGVHEMGYALNQSGLVAAQFGLSVEDTTGALAEFASAGLIGSDAGTSFKTMMLAMANPTSKTSRLMQELGISFYDAQGKFVGVSGVAQTLQEHLKGLTQQQRNQALGQIFGNDAIRAASILYTDGAQGVDKWRAAVNDAGYASRTASIQTDNLAGDMERLKGSLETLAIQGGSGGSSGLRFLTKSLNDVVNVAVSLPPVVSTVLTILAALTGALILGAVGWVKYRKVMAETQEQLIAIGPAGEKAAAGLSTLTSLAGKLTAWSLALEAGAAALNSLDKKDTDVDALTNSLTNLMATGNSSKALGDTFGDNFSKLHDIAGFAKQADEGFGKFMNTTVAGIPVIGEAGAALGNFGNRLLFGMDAKSAAQNMQALDASLSSAMTSSNDASKSFELWNKVLDASGLNTDELAKQLPSAYKELGMLSKAAEDNKDKMNAEGKAAIDVTDNLEQQRLVVDKTRDTKGNFTKASDASAAAMLGESDALKQLSKLEKEQTDPVFALIQGQIDLKKAHDDASTAINKYGVNSDQARQATNKLANAALDMQEKAGSLGIEFNGKLSPALLATLKSAGLTDAQIKILTGEFQGAQRAANDFAGKYNAHVSVTGYPEARNMLDRLSVYQQALKTGKIAVGFNGPIKGPDGQYYAEGGWTGPGSKYQPAGIVHADEFVINKDSRQKIEATAPGLLDSMNSTGRVPGYAGGGAVYPFPVDATKTQVPSKSDVTSAVLGSLGFGGGAGGTNAGSGQLAAWIMAGIAATGVPANWASPLHTLIMRESGGNPRSINLTDINAQHGDPSRGLMQTIGSTFEAYRLGSLPDDIYNPVANIAAGIRYILSRYGSIFHVQQADPNRPPMGYEAGGRVGHTAMAGGGMITEPIFGVGNSGRTYSFGEGYKPEQVTPMWQGSGASGGSGGNTTVIHLNAQLAAGANIREAGRQIAEQLQSYLYAGGTVSVRGKAVLP